MHSCTPITRPVSVHTLDAHPHWLWQFLFPHIFKVVATAERCKHASFDTRENMWWNLGMGGDITCTEGVATMDNNSELFFAIYLKALPAAFLWGAGTAMGEIPPYMTAYTAKACGEEDDELAEMEDLHAQDTGELTKHDPVTATKIWMIRFMKHWGMMGVFLMSAWPNALFDLCGICCGCFLMPFWHFFAACFAGKACVKAPIQCAVVRACSASRLSATPLTAGCVTVGHCSWWCSSWNTTAKSPSKRYANS